MAYNYVYTPGTPSLSPTSTKTANYTAAVNELVIVDGTSSSPVITLPQSPPNGATVAVKRWDTTYTAANVPTVAVGSGDAFLGGSTTAANLYLQGQVFVLQYSAASAQWIVRSTDEPLSGLDARYQSTAVEYTSTQTNVAVPAGITGVWIDALIGPGGGGGSGRRGTSGTACCGGGGGGGGGAIFNFFVPAARLGATFTVTLPAGGPGGAAVTANDTNGNTPGPPSQASFSSGTFLMQTWAPASGSGGTNASGAGGNNGGGLFNGASGGAASATGAAGAQGGFTFATSPAGGGAGGGITTAPAASNGGAGGWQIGTYSLTSASGGVVGGASPGSGNAAAAGIGGQGAAGGAASITGAAQAGASATGYGAGGGGGGASLNGNSSGAAGGSGGPSYCRLRWMYV